MSGTVTHNGTTHSDNGTHIFMPLEATGSEGVDPAAWRYEEAGHRRVSVDLRLEGMKMRRARRRAARALRPLDRRFARLAKQLDVTTAWKKHADKSLAHQDALSDQPTSLVLHVGRKVGVMIAEFGFTFAALDLAGIPSRNLRFLLAIALSGLLVLAGQTIARTMKRAHLASAGNDTTEATGDEAALNPVEPPSGWDWSIAGLSVAFLIAFAAALTTLRESYNHAIAQARAAAIASQNTQLTVAAPQHTVPGWVLAILALVAPLIAILAEYAQYHPHAHRLRRSLRLYAWNARKLRFVLHRCGRPVNRGRRALLAFDSPRSRAFRMKHVVHAIHGGPIPVDEQIDFDADEPIRQLRNRLNWYDRVAELSREALLDPRWDTIGNDPSFDELESLLDRAAGMSKGETGLQPEVVV
jgi:hypothetical protein